MTAWVSSFHDKYLMHTLLIRKDPSQLQSDIRFLERVLEVPKGGKILDQCCGIGSLSIPLAQRGYNVVGVDITPAYIQQAQESKSLAAFFCSDARTFRTEDCDAVFNWWTGFGYYESENENTKLISSAFASLRSGGLYLLDVPNGAGVIRHFKAKMCRTYETEMGTISLERNTILDVARSRMEKTWIYRQKGIVCAQHETSVRLYHSHELIALFRQVGFVDVRVIGDYAESSLGIDHLRCICMGRKP